MSASVFRSLIAFIAIFVCFHPAPSDAAPTSTVQTIRERGVLLWGSDSEGGAPYVFPDPKDPSKLIGFELDIAEAVAKKLGVKARLVQTAWDSLIPALERGDYDMAMNGLEIIAEREKRALFSRPYYVYTLQLMVRKDETRIRSIHDLAGRTVGTLAGAVAHDLLTRIGKVDIRSYSAAWPYEAPPSAGSTPCSSIRPSRSITGNRTSGSSMRDLPRGKGSTGSPSESRTAS